MGSHFGVNRNFFVFLSLAKYSIAIREFVILCADPIDIFSFFVISVKLNSKLGSEKISISRNVLKTELMDGAFPIEIILYCNLSCQVLLCINIFYNVRQNKLDNLEA